MVAKTIPVTFRVSRAQHEELAIRGAKDGLTVQQFAERATLEALDNKNMPREILRELKSLRNELALATEATLTVSARGPEDRKKAAAWVKKNLNRR